eukprot:762047-Pelagomonas_calceolata.AAC.1
MVSEPQALGQQELKGPSLSLGASHLFAHGIFEEDTRPNLAKPISQLVPEGKLSVLTVNDKKLAMPLRVQLKWASTESGENMKE